MDPFFKDPYNLAMMVTAAVAGGMLLSSFLRKSGSEVSATDATLLINREDAIVLDVRDPAEFAQGHIPNARNIPVDKLAERLGELDKFKERTVVAVCASGVRSGKACGELKKAGFAKVVNLAGGIGAWTQAGLPVSRKK
ncbi:hypothetical protein OTERR_04970 [Oryzomicrobium terrae]|uniref:Rhodanese domain-containing protein n=1 Tax=Oryzomicrobium terrae TaxID=1735038 RepID=A0A5C1E525_9RHOO|nr:rhodanese-like domain-containing protein [Oryzomicrobium terrae]QEL63973.1 hypothetical protein OTERR_04970 [Oryzomicrobium terrae]